MLTLHCLCSLPGLSKAETQALTNYGSGEDENEVEEMEEFEAEPQDVQTSLQASNDGVEQRVRTRAHTHSVHTLPLDCLVTIFSCISGSSK